MKPWAGRCAAGLAVVALSLWAGPAQAQAPTELSLEELLDLEAQSVFGASKTLQRLTEAPAAVSIVTADDIERYGWQTLADVFKSIRGLYVTDDRSWAYVGVRGFLRPGDYNTRVLLTIDGHRVNDNIYDQALIQEDFALDLRDVERIEIIRGPASSLYGSNAFFGVINVVSKARTAGGDRMVSADVGSLGLKNGRFTTGHSFANGIDLSVSTTFQDIDGLGTIYYPEYDDPTTNLGKASGLDFSQRRNVFATASLKSVTLRTGFNTRKRGMPTGAYGVAFGDPRASVTDNLGFLDVSWQSVLPSGWVGRFRGAFDHYTYRGAYPYGGEWDESGTADVLLYLDRGFGTWVTGEAEVSRRFGTAVRLTAGVEERVNMRQRQTGGYEGDPLEVSVGTQGSTTGIYGQGEIRVHPSVLLNLGLRYDRYLHFDDPLKPRMAVILQPEKSTTVKFIIGQAFRAPNAFEQFYEAPPFYKPNPDLHPEEIQTVEAIVERLVGRRLRLSSSLFTYTVNELLDLTVDPADGNVWYQNADTARANGFEAEAEARWPRGVHARVSYAFTDVRDGRDAQLSNAPRHITQALFSAPVGRGHVAAVEARSLGSRLTRSGTTVGAYVVANVTLSGPLVDRRLRYQVVVTNLADRRYADPVGADFVQEAIPQNGRAVRARVAWTF